MAGMTLVELLVAMTLGLLVMGAAALVFGATSRNRTDLERAARLTENAQYALDFLGDELRVAGYYAELSTVGVTWQAPDPCATTLGAQGWSSAPFIAPVGLAGYRRDEPVPVCLLRRKAGTAAVVVRRASVDVTPVAQASGSPFIQVSKCALDAKTWVVSDKPGDFTLRNLDCITPADVRQLFVRAYYVADCDDCASDAMPTLKRAELANGSIAVTPLVEGIENLQLEYGFDGDGDGIPDRWLDRPDPLLGAAYGTWSNVMSVRVYALARASDAQTGYVDASKSFNLGPAGYTNVANDGFHRVQLSSIVRLNNAAGARETP
jgi:type IV pilus assembly protein PilW